MLSGFWESNQNNRMGQNPLVSVVIPTYNMASSVGGAVRSVLAQTYENIEVIVVDDGSTDNTQEILKEFTGRIKYFYKENGGTCSARNLGLRESRGEYIGFIDSDDEYLPEKVEQCLNYLQNHPDYFFVHTAAFFIDGAGNTLGQYSHPRSRHRGWITNQLIFGNYICNPTVFMRRVCFQSAGNFDETIFQPADWDMWLRICELFKAGYLDRPLSKYRVSSCSVYNHLEKSRREETMVIDKFFSRHRGRYRFLKGRVYSALHLRYAQCYYLQDNRREFKRDFFGSIRYHPLNVKAWGLLVCSLVAPERLKGMLRKKILRVSF